MPRPLPGGLFLELQELHRKEVKEQQLQQVRQVNKVVNNPESTAANLYIPA